MLGTVEKVERGVGASGGAAVGEAPVADAATSHSGPGGGAAGGVTTDFGNGPPPLPGWNK